MERGKFLQFNYGEDENVAHVEAVHPIHPKGEFFTGNLVNGISRNIGASSLESVISRDQMDLNRPRNSDNYPAVDEYREVLHRILARKNLLNEKGWLKTPFLHLSFHGMQDYWDRDFEIGTGYGNYCLPEVKSWFIQQLKQISRNFGVDDIFPGFTFRSILRDGDVYGSTSFLGFGPYMNTIQVEISHHWRRHYSETLVEFFTELIKNFHHYSPEPDYSFEKDLK